MSGTRVICIGEAMVEIALDDHLPGPAMVSYAGDTFNTAIYTKRAAPALQVSFATKVGRDPLSKGLLALMRSEGLDTSLVGISDTSVPGLYTISTDATGEREFAYWRDTSAARLMFRPPALSFDALAGCDLIYLSAVTLAILPVADRQALLDWLAHYRATGGRVAFDSNYRPALWPDRETARAAIETAWRQTDIGFPGLDDEMALFGDADATRVLRRLTGLGVGAGALKRGAAGPVALDGSSSPAGPFEPAACVIDTTAAGDSFNGAYLAAMLQGRDSPACLMAGHRLALRVLAVRGAIIPGARPS